MFFYVIRQNTSHWRYVCMAVKKKSRQEFLDTYWKRYGKKELEIAARCVKKLYPDPFTYNGEQRDWKLSVPQCLEQYRITRRDDYEEVVW